ncbi:MAG: AbrB/MazE/SpoVT family DNA-binding domain-containing protein [Deltaproteobacteria bacterium]|nr:AbrB/MazE/SpoVT family DNA-binding domain-containing protein [Deltaproteobacteria bacterium]
MLAVKVLPKGQITIPKALRKALDIHEGDTLMVEGADEQIVIRKGKTIFDFAGSLPGMGMSLDEIREKAIEAGVANDD